ncbi:MAG: hypothetical protein ACI4MP_02380 [Candidatus Ventricola sp.]
MKDKDLKRMSRAELLELLIDKTRENETLHAQLDEALAQLDDRMLRVEKAGTMAEAALLVNGVLDAAQRAGQQYMENMRERWRQQEENCTKLEEESRAQADQLLVETRQRCRKMEQDTQQRCAELYRVAEQEANGKWDDLFAQLDQLRSENAQLQQMLSEQKKKRKWGL